LFFTRTEQTQQASPFSLLKERFPKNRGFGRGKPFNIPWKKGSFPWDVLFQINTKAVEGESILFKPNPGIDWCLNPLRLEIRGHLETQGRHLHAVFYHRHKQSMAAADVDGPWIHRNHPAFPAKGMNQRTGLLGLELRFVTHRYTPFGPLPFLQKVPPLPPFGKGVIAKKQ
jgi:hypothetical protein